MDLNIRNFRWSDMAAVVDVMNRAEPDRPTPRTVDAVEAHWRAPHHHVEQDCFVALTADDQLVAVGIADLLDQPNESNSVLWYVPSYVEAGRQLLRTIEAYFGEKALAKSPPDVPIWLNYGVVDTAHELIGLLESEGFEAARRFYTMKITLDQPVQALPAPDGITLRPIDLAREARAVYNAQQEAFREHWGYYAQPYDEWLYPTTLPNFQPEDWWAALDEDAIVGMILSTVRGTDYGWVDVVGVRPAWRKRGIASVLLNRAFAALQARGVQQVELTVDTDNTTKALVLYEQAGMYVANSMLIYRKYLRKSSPSPNP